MVNWEAILGSLVLLVVMALFAERALAVLFEWRAWAAKLDGRGLKTPVTVAFSYLMCHVAAFDALTMAFGAPVSVPGTFLTALIVAGGAKKVIELMWQVAAIREHKPGGG